MHLDVRMVVFSDSISILGSQTYNVFEDIERLILGSVWACLVTFLSHLGALLILLKSGARRSDLRQAAIVDLNDVFATLCYGQLSLRRWFADE